MYVPSVNGQIKPCVFEHTSYLIRVRINQVAAKFLVNSDLFVCEKHLSYAVTGVARGADPVSVVYAPVGTWDSL